MDNNKAPFVHTFDEVSLPAWFAIHHTGGKIVPSVVGYTCKWEITFPEGTIFDGPTKKLRFKRQSYTLPNGHHVWSDYDRNHVYSEDEFDEGRNKFRLSPKVIFDHAHPSRIGVSHYVRTTPWGGYYDKPVFGGAK